jgi:Tol biopolymer transport system component
MKVARKIAWLVAITGLVGCEDGTGPSEGSLLVATHTTGQGIHPDGYLVRTGAGPEQVIGATDTLLIPGLAAGVHEVELTGVAENCAITGTNPRSVTVTGGATTRMVFEVACAAVVRPAPSGRIAFSSDRAGNFDIYVMSADGLTQSRLTTDPAWDGVPAVSPDGLRILFESMRDGNNEIYVMNADGTGQTNLTRHPAADERPTWSPDGTKILFVSDRDGDLDIFVMDADGSNAVNLTRSPGIDRPASWSPDGTKIAFSTNRTGDFEIFIMNADGSDPVNLTNDPARVDFAPAWAPDGARIAYTSRLTDAPRTDVLVMNADGSGRRDLTANPATDDRGPSWSPDGAWIVFTTDRTGNPEVFAMRPDGTGAVNLSNSPGWDVAGWPQAWGGTRAP